MIKLVTDFLHIFMGFWFYKVFLLYWLFIDVWVEIQISLHESCCWSDIHKKWFFLPRRMSKEPYDKDLDEYRCGNILICADVAFQDISVISIGKFVNKICPQNSNLWPDVVTSMLATDVGDQMCWWQFWVVGVTSKIVTNITVTNITVTKITVTDLH